MAHTNHAYTSMDFLNATEICCSNGLLQLNPPNSRHHLDFVEGLFSFRRLFCTKYINRGLSSFFGVSSLDVSL